ncbi:MAG: hypothetical protein ACRD3O_21630, partial [Terriglobia bacterium]
FTGGCGALHRVRVLSSGTSKEDRRRPSGAASILLGLSALLAALSIFFPQLMAGALWAKRPPAPLFEAGPVVRVAKRAHTALSQAFAQSVKSGKQAAQTSRDAGG